MSLPSFLQPHPNGVLLLLKIQPRASRNAIAGVMGNELKITVTAPPVDDAANEAVIEFLSGLLDCHKGSVHILRGRTSRHKQVLVTGLRVEEVAAAFR